MHKARGDAQALQHLSSTMLAGQLTPIVCCWMGVCCTNAPMLPSTPCLPIPYPVPESGGTSPGCISGTWPTQRVSNEPRGREEAGGGSSAPAPPTTGGGSAHPGSSQPCGHTGTEAHQGRQHEIGELRKTGLSGRRACRHAHTAQARQMQAGTANARNESTGTKGPPPGIRAAACLCQHRVSQQPKHMGMQLSGLSQSGERGKTSTSDEASLSATHCHRSPPPTHRIRSDQEQLRCGAA